MMRTAPTLVAAVILATLMMPVDASPPDYPCFRADVPPVIDGDSGDACWQAAPFATGFSVLGDGFTDAKQTAFRACWDGTAMYLLVVCEEPDVAALRLNVRDGGQVWFDDSIEIFLQPSGAGSVYQFGITAAAARTTGAGTADFRKFEAAAGLGAASYTLEIAIPHELVGASPAEGDTWRGNVCRNIWTTISGGDKFTCWAPLQRQFLEPANFAALELRGGAPSAAAIAALTRDLNSGYQQYLLAEVEQLVTQAPVYFPVLKQARESEEFGGTARELLYQWYRLARAQDTSGRYSIRDLREMVQSAEGLLARSYEVKYAYLIDELFPD